jgi:hypothetical protein
MDVAVVGKTRYFGGKECIRRGCGSRSGLEAWAEQNLRVTSEGSTDR